MELNQCLNDVFQSYLGCGCTRRHDVMRKHFRDELKKREFNYNILSIFILPTENKMQLLNILC